jgi:hypothetical protein
MRSSIMLSRLVASGLFASLVGTGGYAVADPKDNRLCIEETAPIGAPLSGGYAEFTVTDQRLGRAQVYGTACFKNPLLGDAEECFPEDGAMVIDLPTNLVHISLVASALATVPAANSFLGFAQQSLTLDTTTLVGTYRNLGFLVSGGVPSQNYFDGTAKGVACKTRPILERRRQRGMSRFIDALDSK